MRVTPASVPNDDEGRTKARGPVERRGIRRFPPRMLPTESGLVGFGEHRHPTACRRQKRLEPLGGGSELFVLLFDHSTSSQTANVWIAGGVGGNGHLYRFTQSTPLADGGSVATTASGFSLALPARSASLVVVPTVLFADGFESGSTSAWSTATP